MRTLRETRRNLWIMAAIVVLAAAAALVGSFLTTDPDLKKALQGASLALVFGSLLGGFVKLLLDDFDRGRQQRTEHVQFCLTMLADLKSVYDQIERARVLIPGHQSAKTYGNEMRGLIEARVKLLNVIRAVNVELLSPVPGQWQELKDCGSKMEAYLVTLIDEFVAKYKDISDKQAEHEAIMDTFTKQRAKEPTKAAVPPLNVPWAEICELASMKDFLNLHDPPLKATNYETEFVAQLDRASDLLTGQVKRALR